MDRVCRHCLGYNPPMLSLFADRHILAFFQILGNIDISKDENKVEAMICNNCQIFFGAVQQQIQNVDQHIFQPLRKQIQELTAVESEPTAEQPDVSEVFPDFSIDVLMSEMKNENSITLPPFEQEGQQKGTSLGKFQCDLCGKYYGAKNTLRRHMRSKNEGVKYPCEFYGKGFTRQSIVKLHQKKRCPRAPKVEKN